MTTTHEKPKPATAAAKSAHADSPNQALYRLARTMIPGGTQLLSKRPEMFAPDQWPAYYREAHGVEIVDFDGRKLIDMTSTGIGACLLGYCDQDVTAAVVRRVQAGSMCTLNSPDEVELAQLLLEIHPWAQNVRYGRAGGESMAIAARIARAKTGREVIAFCGYHGWHDWYLAANRVADGTADALKDHLLPGLSPRGVPSRLAGTALPFNFNKIDELNAIVSQHGKNLAAVIMEPTRSVDPEPGFLEAVREICDRTGAVLVFDEVTAGWRMILGGSHLRYTVRPDIAVFAKAIGNGHPMAAIIGRAEVMQAAQDSFISSTYWTEGIGPAAALATLRKMKSIDLPGHVTSIANRLRTGMAEIAKEHKLPLKISGHPALTFMSFDHPDPLALQTLWTVRMLDRSILAASGFYATWAHQNEHVDQFLAATDEIAPELAQAIQKNDIRERIGGPVRHAGFARLS